MIVIGIFATVAVMATNSRQLFAFARDNGVPFANFFGTVSGSDVHHEIPETDDLEGLTPIRDSTQLHIRHNRGCCAPFIYPAWVYRRLQSDTLPRSWLYVDFIYGLDWVHCLEKNSWRASVAVEIQSWQVWSPYQHHFAALSGLHLGVLFFPTDAQPRSCRYELGGSWVWYRDYLLYNLLPGVGEQKVCRTCRVY